MVGKMLPRISVREEPSRGWNENLDRALLTSSKAITEHNWGKFGLLAGRVSRQYGST